MPLGETKWRITSPVQSPAQPGPLPAPALWTLTMSKLHVWIHLLSETVFVWLLLIFLLHVLQMPKRELIAGSDFLLHAVVG